MSTQILLVSGSLQRASANRAVLDVAREALASQLGVRVIESDELRAIPAFNPDDQERATDAVNTFRRQIGEADAVLFAVPEYAAALPGALKNALDWVVGSGELYGTLAAVVSAGTTGGPTLGSS